ncbi:uncharacterized protein F4812DRAFT_460489 [Daldinia caldariorum]|uniref:uncharacterized protein n=1 Tax=Daldinia caldariorum TaxID=326644 RepID=UPI002007272F|nr:uncharacterized protein F4812DRAFT_460489 [Daldinia caldariorum]KAI1466933.1 hypothetical protein F4812DRAFT_460489 [Daldinia caldariorum]
MSAKIPSSSELRPSRLTFGVEMEFVVPWLYKSKDGPLATSKDIIYDRIKDLFERHNLPTKVKTYKYKSNFDKRLLSRYDHWGVENDITVFEPSDEPAFEWVDDFEWVGVEIQSPVEPDVPVAFDVLDYGRQLLASTYRCRVNHSCGLHVHVGNGSERFPLESMRRIASLVFATEHLLITLNHPWRTANLNARTLRDRSNLAHKLAGNEMSSGPNHKCKHAHTDCVRYYATDVRHGEQPISWREQHRDPKFVDAFEQVRKSGFEPFQPVVDETTPSSPVSKASSVSGTQSSESTPGSEEDAKSEEGTQSSESSPGNKEEEKEEKSEEETQSSTSSLSSKSSKGEGSGEESPKEGSQSKKTLNGSQKQKQVDDPFKHSNKPFPTRSIPRIKLPRYTTEQLIEFHDKLEEFGADGLLFEGENAHRSPDPGVFAAVEEIYQAPSSCAIAHLMFPWGASRVNFQHYACDSFDRADLGRTIEFRGAEGSLGPWVVTWAKICVGLVRFAVRSPPSEFVRVLENCQRAEERDGAYDCIDLLNDLGLFAEAVVAARRIAENKDDWGLEYVEEEPKPKSEPEPEEKAEA